MKKYLLSSLAFLFAIISSAQTVIVFDAISQQTIPGVIIYSNNPKASAYTNNKGEAELSNFRSSDSIYFRYMGYKIAVYSYTRIESMKFKVGLSESNISLGAVIISANRWEENEIETPNRIQKIGKKEVAFLNPQTSADMLGTSGYAYIQKSQLGGGSPILRGFATNRVMLVVDGVRMNNAIFRAGNLQNVISLDAASMESAEILFGPGAVMYGSDAIGGVMDFHTLHPKLTDSTGKLLVIGNAFGRYSSANTEKSGHIDFNIGLKKIAFVTSFSYSDYDDLRTGSHGNAYFLRPTYVETVNGKDSTIVNAEPALQVGSGYSQINFMQKIRIQPNRSWDIDYAFHYSATSDIPRYDRLTLDDNADGVPDNAVWYYGPQKWMMNRLGITHSKATVLYNQMRIVAATQRYEESRHDRKFNNKKLRNQTESVDALSANFDLDKKMGEKATLFYGAEIIHNAVGSTSNRIHIVTNEEEPTATRYPNGSTWQAYGAYTSLKYKLSQKWIMNTGLRYSHFIVKADFDTTLFPFPFVHTENKNGSLNGSLGFVYSPNTTWQIYLNGSTGFRSPNIDDIGKVFESEPGAVVVPNSGLKPEYAYNAEIGSAKIFGDFLKADFAAYYTLLDNALARRDFQYNGQDSILYDGQMSRVQAIQNIAKAYVYGIQAGMEFSFGKGVGLKSNISYQFGEEQSEDSLIYYPKSHLAPLFGNTHLTYQRKNFKLDLYADYNARLDYEDLALSERNDDAPYAKDSNGLPFVPAWYTINFKAAWYINKILSLNAGLENITDQRYRTFASGISAPGRNVMVALRMKF